MHAGHVAELRRRLERAAAGIWARYEVGEGKYTRTLELWAAWRGHMARRLAAG